MKKILCGRTQLIDWMQEGKKIVCFGMGQKFRVLCNKVPFGSNIRVIVDNNQVLWGEKCLIHGKYILIESPQNVFLQDDDIVLITTAYYQEVERQIEKLENWNAIKEVYYIPSKADENFFITQSMLSFPIQDKIAFRTGPRRYIEGFDYSDNTRALFEYLIEHGYNKRYSMVWFMHKPERFPQLKEIENVFLVSNKWETSEKYEEYFTYFYHLCTAKYLFTTDNSFWMRYCIEGQKRINLWHGCGFKARAVLGPGPQTRHYELMTVTSPLYADIHAKYHGLSRSQLIDTGLAKQDWLFQPMKDGIGRILDLPKSSKYVFWLPTFRWTDNKASSLNTNTLASSSGFPIVTNKKLAKELDDFLDSIDTCLIIKPHPAQAHDGIDFWKMKHIFVIENKVLLKKDIMINQLLSKADALISDYSSVAIDFMLLDRPIAFMLEDMEQYGESRGFVFDNLKEYLPGVEVYTFDQLENFLREVAEGIDSSREKRHRLTRIMHTHQDGNNCKRILESIGLE